MSSTASVLIIDDSAVDRDLFRRQLRSQAGTRSFHCLEEARARAGLDQIRRARPDCVLLDLNLPDMDGLDLLRSILQDPDPCPVIVVTAYGTEEVAVEAMKSGATDYVVKGSVSAEGLCHAVENALEKRTLQRQVEQQRVAIEERNRELESALEREREAHRAAAESESRYRTLAEAMPQVVWTAVHPHGGWDYVNERWSRLTGAPPDSAVARGWLDFIDPKDRDSVRDSWKSSVASLRPLELQCRIRTGSGPSRWQLMRALPLIVNSRPVKWLGTLTDIEDQRRAEHLLHHRQKLESIGVLAGGIAHDFNNLLVGIIGGVSYALEVLPPQHDLRPVLDVAFKAGERAAHLTRQMLAYAGKGNFQVEDVDLGQMIHETWQLIQASIPSSVNVKLLVRPGLPLVRAGSAQLQQIVMNLIINAGEAIPSGRPGFIIVSTDVESVDSPRTTWSSDLAPGEYVVLEVRDNGCGIEPANLGKIFDPFFTTKFTGRGLGLAAVHGIVRSNRGSIEVDSAPGMGSTFRVLLPVSVATRESRANDSPVPPGNTKPGRILLVDDEEIVRNTTRAALEHAGHSVAVASGGLEALERLSAAPDSFSLVLLDLSMPELDGEQTLEALRLINSGLPVVICSGYSEMEVKTRFQGKAVNGFLRKPFNVRTLQETVSQVLGSAG
ncbi:MAG TPA: response regulator [Bryobacteraceae bacterium]|nr:response regulator [Bryobacteraceae bacterium]